MYRAVTQIRKDGRDYSPGDLIELTPVQAKAMPWAIEPVPEQATIPFEPVFEVESSSPADPAYPGTTNPVDQFTVTPKLPKRGRK